MSLWKLYNDFTARLFLSSSYSVQNPTARFMTRLRPWANLPK